MLWLRQLRDMVFMKLKQEVQCLNWPWRMWKLWQLVRAALIVILIGIIPNIAIIMQMDHFALVDFKIIL